MTAPLASPSPGRDAMPPADTADHWSRVESAVREMHGNLGCNEEHARCALTHDERGTRIVVTRLSDGMNTTRRVDYDDHRRPTTPTTPPLDTDEYRILVLDHGTGETLADVRRLTIGAARCRAFALHRKHGGEVVRVQQRGFDVALVVVDGEWRPVDKAVRT